MNFWDSSTWVFILLISVLFGALIVANILKRYVKLIHRTLIPTSVLAGLLLLIISSIYTAVTKTNIFESKVFGGNGLAALETITYHCLALGFISMTFKSQGKKLTKKRSAEIFNTGVTTVSTYLIQAIFGLIITFIFASFVTGLLNVSGVILAFGFGQGTGQAMNYGVIFETEHGFVGGKEFGLSIAALGFLVASIGGVVHLNILRAKGKIKVVDEDGLSEEKIEITQKGHSNGTLDSLTIQIALVFLVYVGAYVVISVLGNLASGVKSILYGFNFLFGVLITVLVKNVLKFVRTKGWAKTDYIDDYLMDKLGCFFFDFMIVAGIAAICVELLVGYFVVLIVLAVTGFVVTYFYNRFIAKTLFKDYEKEQFLAMFGMLTGTASTGIILLKEVDPEFKTPVAENLVYQNFPAIVFGFPMMLLVAMAPEKPLLTFCIFVAFFLVMNIILFRSKIFRKKAKTE